jgi:RHS repeat-associated protein
LFGYGWTSNVGAQLVDSGLGPITLIDEDNTRHIFGQDTSGGYIAAGGDYFTLVKNADATYTLTRTDGTKTNFNTTGKISSIVDTNGNTTTYTYDGSGKLTSIKDASQRSTTIAYGTNGYISSITDPANNKTTFGYDTSGNLTSVTDPANKVTGYAYDTSHRLTGVTNPLNVTTTFGYDTTNNRVTSVSQPITINGVVQTSTTNYTYDTTNLVTTDTDGEGRRIDYTYNANCNVVQVSENPLDSTNKSVTTYSYDNNNNLTQVIDPNTNKINGTSSYIYTYDAKGNITAVQLPGSQKSYNTYDSANNLTQSQDYNSNINTYNYDSKNNQIESTDPNTQTAATRYDSYGNLTDASELMSTADNLAPNSGFEQGGTWPDHWTHPANTAWSTTSKFGSKAISISNPTAFTAVTSDKIPYSAGSKYIASGYVKTASITGTALIKVEFFNASGTLLGQQTSYQITGTQDWTRLQTVVDTIPANTASLDVVLGLNTGSGTAYFDGVQLENGTVLSAYNLIENSSFERKTGSGTVPDYWTTSGNLSASDGIDNTTSFVGQNSFKLTGQSGVNKYVAQHITVSGDATTPLTLSGWSKQSGANPNGGYYDLQVAINYTDSTVDWTNANNFINTASGWQHVAAVVNPTKAFNSIDVYYYFYNQTGTAWFDAMRLAFGPSMTFNTYDTNGNYVTNVTNPQGNEVSNSFDIVGNMTSFTDGNGKKTTYGYDPRNLLNKVTDAKQGVTSYGYDDAGNMTTATDASNHKTTYGYNEFNAISSITNPLNQTIRMGYDKNGNTTDVTYPKGDKVTYMPDANNRLSTVSYNGALQWTYAYDANGNVKSITDSTGKVVSNNFDANNRLTEQAEGSTNKIDFGYDANSNISTLTATAGSTTITTGYGYNSNNQTTSLSRNSINQAKFVYDEKGNVISVTRAVGTYSSYEYDGANRLVSVNNYNAAGALLDSYKYSYDGNGNQTSVVTSSGTINYQYDALNQLTQETLLDGSTILYTYDAVGNRLSKTVTKGTTTTTNYTYDASNQLTAVNGQTYTYDANGNLTGNGANTYIYDVENRLTQVKNSSGTSLATFTYNNEGKRTSMTTATGTVYFHYNGDKVIYETDANNNVVADYTWDDQGNPVTMTKSGVTYYYHINGHGDVTSLTDSSGTVVAQYQYDAWGNILSQTGSMASSNPYRYAGYRYDVSTGLYYLMTRYYDPNVGRFITRDSYPGFRNDPLSLNRYNYTDSNPVNNVDPYGYWSFNKSITKSGYWGKFHSSWTATVSVYGFLAWYSTYFKASISVHVHAVGIDQSYIAGALSVIYGGIGTWLGTILGPEGSIAGGVIGAIAGGLTGLVFSYKAQNADGTGDYYYSKSKQVTLW